MQARRVQITGQEEKEGNEDTKIFPIQYIIYTKLFQDIDCCTLANLLLQFVSTCTYIFIQINIEKLKKLEG